MVDKLDFRITSLDHYVIPNRIKTCKGTCKVNIFFCGFCPSLQCRFCYRFYNLDFVFIFWIIFLVNLNPFFSMQFKNFFIFYIFKIGEHIIRHLKLRRANQNFDFIQKTFYWKCWMPIIKQTNIAICQWEIWVPDPS